jgi:hypothetical protein
MTFFGGLGVGDRSVFESRFRPSRACAPQSESTAPQSGRRARFRAIPAAAWALAAMLFRPAAPGSAQTVYGYTFTPPTATGTPRIISVELNSDRLRAGGPIDIRVTTTPDVVRVVTGSGRRQGTLSRIRSGVFTSDSTLPHVGGLLSVGIKLHFVASTAAGKTISIDVPVHYR